MTNEEMILKVKGFIDKRPNEHGNLIMEGYEMQAIAQMLYTVYEVLTELSTRDLKRDLQHIYGIPSEKILSCVPDALIPKMANYIYDPDSPYYVGHPKPDEEQTP